MRHDPPEYSLIAAALAGARPLDLPDWDWDRTVKIAAREEVLPTLHKKLWCPPEVSDFFEAIYELNAARNSQLLREVESLASLLNRAGIEPVLLKGAAYLVTGVYSDPADRLLHDIDFLVRPSQSAQAFEVIRSSGYEPYIPNPAALVYHHHPMLTRAHRVPVEIHHSLGLGICGNFLRADEVVQSSGAFRIGDATVRIPTVEHLVVHLILHSQIHHGPYDRIWPSLRSMTDLVLLQRRFEIDWASIRKRFESNRKTAILNLHLMQVEKVMGVHPPFPLSVGAARWWYRQTLWTEPRLRYVDPIYTVSRMVLSRLRLSWRLLRHPIGRKYLFSIPFRPSFYKKLLDDIAHG